MSLRARLVAGLLVLVGAAIVVVSVVSYTALRSYLFDQVDAELDRAALFPRRSLADGRPVGPPPGGSQDPGADPFALNATYIELRDPAGVTVALFPIQRGSVDEPPPAVPTLESGQAVDERFTVESVDGSFRYRLLVEQVPGAGSVIVGVSLREADAALRRLLVVELMAGAAVLILVALLGSRLVRLGLKPLDHMAETAGAIAAGDLTQRVTQTDDRTEVGRLGQSFNTMIGQIEVAFDQRSASEDRLRRFAADASHELRTPLTSIRGYAELYRRGAMPDPAEVDRAMERIESEATRMGVLVDDLLLLARLDQGRPLHVEPVDLVGLVRDVVSDAEAADLSSQPGGASQHPIRLEVGASPVVVAGERGRLHQVVANLIANAQVHTPAGTAVNVTLRCEAGHAVIQVADSGPGMDVDVVAQAFDRFYRADPARTRASGGTGLGLAIVAAVVEAHGGRASVSSEAGRGSTFTVELPLAVEGAVHGVPW